MSRPGAPVRGWPLAPLLAAGVVGATAAGGPTLTYHSLVAEAATEYQVGWKGFGPGFVRLIGSAEVALTPTLNAKAVISPCVGPYGREPAGVTECSPYRIIEELTIGGLYEGFDFSLGRQIVTLGNTEGFVLLDRFNGRDYCRFARLDIQNKLPNWIARGRWSGDDTSLSLLFAPLSGQSELPDPQGYCADRFNDAGAFAELGDPDNDSIADWAGGAELAVTRDRWGATLNVVSTREDLFVLETVPAPAKTRPRTLWLGGTAAATLGGIVVRGELAYAPDRSFTIAPPALAAMGPAGLATFGVDRRSNLLAAIGAEIRKGDWYWALQYFENQVSDGPPLVLDEQSRFASLRLRRTFLNERLTLDAFAVLDLGYRDAALRASVSYEFNQQTTLEIGGTGYAAEGSEPGYFGSYAGRGSLYAKLRRSF